MLEDLLNRTMLRVRDSLTEIQPPNFHRPRKYQANIGNADHASEDDHHDVEIIAWNLPSGRTLIATSLGCASVRLEIDKRVLCAVWVHR
jgi:hypothetical protein